jgi:nucleoid-associated protein YgaU
VHHVGALETLSKICVTYYGDRDLAPALARYNDIADPDRVREGRRLNIPDRARLTGEAPASTDPPSRPTTTNVPVYGTYTLVDGDTLSELAGRFLGSEGKWRELYELNRDRIEDPDQVPSGTTIKVPVKGRQRTSR